MAKARKSPAKFKAYFVSYVGQKDGMVCHGCFLHWTKSTQAYVIYQNCVEEARTKASNVVMLSLNPLP